MRCSVHPSADRFLARSLPWLLTREAENNLILGIALSRSRGTPAGEEAAWFATVEDGDRLVGAAFRTPPHMVGLTDLPLSAVPLLVDAVGGSFREVPGVVGPDRPAEAFADAWCARHPVRPRLEMRMGIYALEQLVPPERPVAGTMRVARWSDRELLIQWMRGFERDTGIFSTGAELTVDRLLEANAVCIWEVAGTPVSMAGTSGRTPNGARVGYVYTPPESRGAGYAGAATAALSRRLLQSGHRWCFLYTNLADPVANGIYHRLGYERVSTAASIRFDPEEA